jgi:elongation factor Ts
MVDISASMVKELREKSGAAMMDCKKALVEASGDFERAFEWLRQKGAATASQKSSRVASEGLVAGQLSTDGKSGVLIEVNCETDFVARNEQFITFTKEICQAALKSRPKTLAELLKLKVGEGTLESAITEVVAKTGENIIIRRFALFDLGAKNGLIGLYVHALGGKMGALMEIASNQPVSTDKLGNVAREVAMHVVSSKPQYLSRAEIAADVIENERRIESGKADLAEKKPEIREKIVAGRVDKIFAERCLVEQPFVKDPALTVGKYLEQKGKELNLELKASRFVLFILGEAAESTNGTDS